MVFQQFGLLPWRSVRDNVGFGLELRGEPPDSRKRIIDEQLELVGLSQWADRHVAELSGGMQQRVGLARALTNDAEILLMDEAYSALDPLIRVDMQTVLLDLQKDLKKTVVFITHDLDEALRLGEKIAILRDGEVIQQGSAAEIVLNPANDYIAAFVKEVNRGRVIKIGAVAKQILVESQLQLSEEMDIEGALREMSRGNVSSAAVMSQEGRALGGVSLQQLLALLLHQA
jgi:glycine betaine/proline transport system ATP-binding protein